MFERTLEMTRFRSIKDYEQQLESGQLMNLPQCELCSGECFDGETLDDSNLVCQFCIKQKNGKIDCSLQI